MISHCGQKVKYLLSLAVRHPGFAAELGFFLRAVLRGFGIFFDGLLKIT